MIKSSPVCTLYLKSLALNIFLGWPPAERMQTQTILLDVAVQFSQPPSACTTDQLEDTHCYDSLIQSIKRYVAVKQFRLLEHLGYELYGMVKKNFPDDVLIKIGITKQPNIDCLTGGVTFCYGDVF